ncbi:ParA family protein [Nocardia goodfellowii]|uniref:Chromosome partitioning protein n=1 Tax=Nocardia goodfellowii TaxID=882446 RepID=A0ABS4QS58_9NOCA|nr:AAA family ATPase [Nocardia goodfellowii]MBP2194556.1 chromosome partitioning protein [Nocardia goodfellowii]
MADAVVVAMANQKGGVGKSTCTLATARAASRYLGARVLVVDMDPQGNVSKTLVRELLPKDEVTLADAITPESDVALREVIVPTIWENVDLAPGGVRLSTADSKLNIAEFGRETALRRALEPVRGDYDLIIIDNPPTLLGQLLKNSLVAADAVVLVTEADEWSADGLALLGKNIAKAREHYNPQLRIIGTIMNKWRETRTGNEAATEIVEGMAKHFPGVPVWVEHKIPLWVGITDIKRGSAFDESKDARLRVLGETVFQPIAEQMLKAVA